MKTANTPDMDQMYFESIDGTTCQRLEYYLHDATVEGLTEITLIIAEPDDGTTDFVWCSYHGECAEHSECKKSICAHYETKSGRGVCKHRGKLYLHGEEVKFQATEAGWVKLEG